MLDKADKDFIEKAIKNQTRMAIALYECAPEGSIYRLVDTLVEQKVNAALVAFFQGNDYLSAFGPWKRVHDTVGEELQKAALGTDEYSRATRAAWIALIQAALGVTEEPEEEN